jgi:hypothetical protein
MPVGVAIVTRPAPSQNEHAGGELAELLEDAQWLATGQRPRAHSDEPSHV